MCSANTLTVNVIFIIEEKIFFFVDIFLKVKAGRKDNVTLYFYYGVRKLVL